MAARRPLGVEAGVVSSSLFTVPALVTTLMTTPLLNLIERGERKITSEPERQAVSGKVVYSTFLFADTGTYVRVNGCTGFSSSRTTPSCASC